MSPDVNALFETFKASYFAGDGNPAPLLDGLSAEDRLKLTRMIEDFLESDPPVEVKFERIGQADVQELTDRAMLELDGATGGLSAMLTRLRRRRKMKFDEVVDALADVLHANGKEKVKIGAYYHDIEYGNLPARGINQKAFDAMAMVFKIKPDALKSAARTLGPAQASSTGPVFARMVDEAVFETDADLASAAPAGESRRSDPPDRIDELFTGG